MIQGRGSVGPGRSSLLKLFPLFLLLVAGCASRNETAAISDSDLQELLREIPGSASVECHEIELSITSGPLSGGSPYCMTVDNPPVVIGQLLINVSERSLIAVTKLTEFREMNENSPREILELAFSGFAEGVGDDGSSSNTKPSRTPILQASDGAYISFIDRSSKRDPLSCFVYQQFVSRYVFFCQAGVEKLISGGFVDVVAASVKWR